MVVPGSKVFVYKLTAAATIGSFLFGYDTGVISGAMLLLNRQFSLSATQQELVVSVTIAAAALFAAAGGLLTNRFGRKPVIHFSSVLFIAGAVTLACAGEFWTLLTGRFVVGAGVGLSSMSTAVYIAEAAPPSSRGRLVTVSQLMITFGQFVASLVDALLSYVEEGWRWMLGLPALAALLQLVVMFWMPESPRWLIEVERYDDAKAALMTVSGGDERAADTELHQLKQIYHEDQQAIGNGCVLLQMLRSPTLRRALAVGCALQMFQQLVGINTVMYYSATILMMAGLANEHRSIWLASVVASMNFLFTFIGLYLVGRVGRRTLTLGSLIGITASLFLFGIGFSVVSQNTQRVSPISPPSTSTSVCENALTIVDCHSCLQTSSVCGFCYQVSGNASCLPETEMCPKAGGWVWTQHFCPSALGWLIVAAMILYLLCFASGMGPMPWTVNAEIYPQWARSTGNACSTTTNWVCNLVISLTFLSLTDAISQQGAYYVYGSIGVVSVVFFYWTLPETKDRTLEETETLFDRSWCSTQRPSQTDYGSARMFRLLSNPSSSSSTEF